MEAEETMRCPVCDELMGWDGTHNCGDYHIKAEGKFERGGLDGTYDWVRERGYDNYDEESFP